MARKEDSAGKRDRDNVDRIDANVEYLPTVRIEINTHPSRSLLISTDFLSNITASILFVLFCIVEALLCFEAEAGVGKNSLSTLSAQLGLAPRGKCARQSHTARLALAEPHPSAAKEEQQQSKSIPSRSSASQQHDVKRGVRDITSVAATSTTIPQ